MAGEGNPTDPAQARLQVSGHVKVVGLLLVQRGHVPTRMRLSDSTSSHNTREFGRNAGVPDGLRAAETAFVWLCQSKMTTVDTTLHLQPDHSPAWRAHVAGKQAGRGKHVLFFFAA
jgi:hypothetical protein